MKKSQVDIEAQAVELATDSFNTFCEDISGMFGVSMKCVQKEVVTEDVSGLKKRFSRLVAVNIVDSKGVLDGTFHILFDQEGLFTIGGVIVMLPEARIMENRESATGELASSMVDAVGEAGNLLIGSWDRVFRDGLKGHGHFLQRLPAFIGKPWNNSEEKIGLSEEQDCTVVLYEMTVASYPPFTCAVVFPRQIVGGESGSASDKEPAAEEEPQEQAEKEIEESKPAARKASTEKTDKTKKEAQAKEPDADETAAEQAEAEEDTEQAQSKAKKKSKSPKAAAKKGSSDKTGKAVKKKTEKKAEPPQAEAKEEPVEEPAVEEAADEPEPQETVEENTASEEPLATDEKEEEDSKETEPVEQDSEEPEAEASNELVEEEPAPAAPAKAEKPARGKVSESIRKMAQSPAILPGESLRSASFAGGELLSLCAGDIMKDDVIWADPEETVQQALSKMQQNDTGYILVGKEGVLEGIASRSDVTGAISPYLRSVFAKWRRPVDYATLHIKVKWIMSRPVRTVTPETSLAAVMESMCRFGGRAIPVVGGEGQVQGLITVFDILQILLQTGAGVSTVGKTPQEPPMA